ncbi:hypothetical protein I41_12690 [Lacipirellula limnantheis]|uniref:Uncharacterized protein n=1 Tax=Lacipirellula limnantheis TaxID=2528024 RepID=A0A517TUQ0_9BACT|nr:hypothetical protein I41_12690 [Lacipirellula limnantheis]
MLSKRTAILGGAAHLYSLLRLAPSPALNLSTRCTNPCPPQTTRATSAASTTAPVRTVSLIPATGFARGSRTTPQRSAAHSPLLPPGGARGCRAKIAHLNSSRVHASSAHRSLRFTPIKLPQPQDDLPLMPAGESWATAAATPAELLLAGRSNRLARRRPRSGPPPNSQCRATPLANAHP